MGLKLAVFASWSLFFSQKSLTEADNVLSFCFRLDDKCHCGVFWNTMAEEPIISQSPNFVMLCDEEGMESCREMCIAMVGVYVARNKNNYTQKVCDHLCGLVVRVLGYRSGGPGSIPGTTRKKK
jgi:hypothetical protein